MSELEATRDLFNRCQNALETANELVFELKKDDAELKFKNHNLEIMLEINIEQITGLKQENKENEVYIKKVEKELQEALQAIYYLKNYSK